MKNDPEFQHRRPIRLQGYDYSSGDMFFVTINTKDHVCLFGEIISGEMYLNAVGKIVLYEWERLEFRFPQIQIIAFVIMPNHIHGIILINDGSAEANHGLRVTSGWGGPTRGSLGVIVGQFKSRVTKRLLSQPDWSKTPVWQRNYYEHIIRNQDELERIYQYIQANPINWEEK